MPITRGNLSTRSDNSAATTGTTSWTSAPTSGHKVIIWVWGGNQSDPTVTDNGSPSRTYTKAITLADATNGTQVWVFYADDVRPSGTYTVTVTFGVAPSDFSVGGLDYGGVSTGGPSATNTNSGTSTSESSGAVTNGSNALYVAGNANNANGSDTVTWGGGFTVQQHLDDGTTFTEGGGGDLINATGSQTATITTTSSRSYVMVIATWAEAAAVVAVRVLHALQKPRLVQRSAPRLLQLPPPVAAVVTIVPLLRALQKPYATRVRSRLFNALPPPAPGQQPIVTYAYSAN